MGCYAEEEYLDRHLFFSVLACRCLQLPSGGDDIRPPAVFLCRDNLCSLLHDCRRVLDVLLDRPQGREYKNTTKYTQRYGFRHTAVFFSQVPARVSLGVTTLLAMSTTQASINSSLPPVAYTKVY